MAAFTKILIANRGEIACRVIRSARAMGYRTVAVFSEADADALHVGMADQAVCIGPAAAAESYLSIEKIIDAANQTGAEAIHPGYGFLSENAAFAEACVDAGITFIGPSPEAITLMGNKAAAKRKMKEAGVPCVPGYEGAEQDDATLIEEAGKIGFPVMIKAAAGGGGRGMRVVEAAEAMPDALAGARSEAKSAFGSDELILEKAIVNPRHVEVQIVGDTHGNVIHLGERDCSIQRRHQKVIEEAPCPILTDELRETMGETGVRAARAVDYHGAGTIEFLLDAEGDFYFLEMNTRLQVEHPVTELVTGIDLVAMQFDIAAGLALDLTQDQIRLNGHAIEARLYAENPFADFMPQTGKALVWEPSFGHGVRVDHGLYAGAEISPHYDPMVAKVIAWGRTREDARRRLLGAVRETLLLGLASNKPFLIEALANEIFIAGQATTGFIADNWGGDSLRQAGQEKIQALAGVALAEDAARAVTPSMRGWRSTGTAHIPVLLETASGRIRLDVSQRANKYCVTIEAGTKEGEESENVKVDIEVIDSGPGRIHYRTAGVDETLRYAIENDVVYLDVNGATGIFTDATYAPAEAAQAGSDGVVRAPTSGKILAVNATVGQSVARNDIIVIIEAMKMENQVLSPVDGVVESVSVAEGDQVHARQVLIKLEALEEAKS